MASLALGACTGPNPAFDPDPGLPGECRAGEEVTERFESFERPDRLDLLVVVDDAGDVLGLQRELARALPTMLGALERGGVDVRVGVMTADATALPGDATGEPRPAPAALAPAGNTGEGCASNTTRVADSSTQDNWIQIAACNVQQGDGGDGFQRAFDVIEHAVLTDEASLQGFRRDRARLLVLVLSNEDDCSSSGALEGDAGTPRNLCAWSADRLLDPHAWAERLQDTAHSPGGIALAVLAGPAAGPGVSEGQPVRPACQSGLGAAYPSPRLNAAAAAFGPSGRAWSVCSLDLSQQLAELTDTLGLVERTTLCPARPLVHEPLRVTAQIRDTGRDAGSDTNIVVPLGRGGFVFHGPTDTCTTGALDLDARALHGVHAVTATYCVESD